jgi:group II intron reverse transcriptase/maturase
VAQAQANVTEGYRFVIDMDLAKFFDRFNHDKLMARVAARIPDRRVLRLIRSYLTAGVLNNGLFEASREGIPQGGPLSPLLSNLVLDELDRELERRGHRFVRYADDCNVYVRSEKAGRRVMASLPRFIEGRLRLQVNAEKSAVANPWRRSFLGFTVTDDPQPRRRIADKAVARFKDRVRGLTRRHRGVSLDRMIADMDPLLRGWAGYFGFSQLHELASLDGLDTETLAFRRLGPVEDAGQSLPRTSSPEGHGEGGQRGHLQPKGTVAAELFGRAASRLHQQTLQKSWVVLHGYAGGRLIRRTAVVRTRMPGGVGGVAS